MAGQRELSFEEDKPVDYVTPVLNRVNEGDYYAARVLIDKIKDAQTQVAVRRTVSVKTGIYL